MKKENKGLIIDNAMLQKMIKAQKRFAEDHEVIREFQPMNKSGTQHADPALHKEKGAVDKQKRKVILRETRFVGWNRGKRYTGEVLRQLRHDRVSKSIKGQTTWADGSPIVKDRIIDLRKD